MSEPATAELSLQIEGMTCGGCVSHVDKALRGVPGVASAAVNLTTGTASVKGAADQKELIAAVERAGYRARVLGVMSAQTLREVESRGEAEEARVRRRLGVGIAAGIPVVAIDLLQWRLMGNHSAAGFLSLAIAQGVLASVVMLYTGGPFFTGAGRALRHGASNMDVLVALGSGVAYGYSLVLLVLMAMGGLALHAHHLEFHAAVAIVVLVTLGKYLEARAKKRASSAVAGLAMQTAATATRLLPDGTLQTVAAEEVRIGDRLQILAHQQLPVDGELVEGGGALDMSLITGESVPVELTAKAAPPALPPRQERRTLSLALAPSEHMENQKSPIENPMLPGGAILADGRIVIRATSTAATSTVARILQLVHSAQASKTQIQALADRVAAVFVPVVVLLALANFAMWILLGGGWEWALLTSIATIIIACPCAMGLATPTAITVAMGRAARMGVLFTQASALESGRSIGTVIFDKTGTLTTGKPRLCDTLDLSADGSSLRLAAAMEQYSEHPLARALVEAARHALLALAAPERFSSIPGGGLRATLDSREYAIGALEFIAEMGAGTQEVATDVERLRQEGKSLVGLAQTGPGVPRLIALFAFQDALREDAGETVRRLRAAGIEVGVVSGDSELAVQGALRDVPVDFVQAGVKPEEKAAVVNKMKSKMKSQKSTIGSGVAFVGDGINDGPALAAADLGIALASGTDLAKAAGDVLLMGGRLTAVPAVLELSGRTLRIIRQNLFWAFAYNVAAIPLAMAGILPPAAAAGAMVVSSLTVVGNALRLRSGGGDDRGRGAER